MYTRGDATLITREVYEEEYGDFDPDQEILGSCDDLDHGLLPRGTPFPRRAA